MESAVLNYLKFEMTAPTAKCFLRLLFLSRSSSFEYDDLGTYC